MGRTFSLLLFMACLSIFSIGCKSPTKKNTSNTDDASKLGHEVTKKNVRILYIDSTIIKKNKALEAYRNQPKIYLNFPSNHAVACKIAILPYTSEEYIDQLYLDGQTYLNNIDSAYVIAQLKNIPQVVVNPDGGTAFGNLDGLDSLNTLQLDTDSRVGVVCAIKIDTNFLCYIMLSHRNWYGESRGILSLMTPHGKIFAWMVSDGQVTPEDPHGHINRGFTLSSANIITVEESADGDNSEHYGFLAKYKAGLNKFTLKKRSLYPSR